MNLLVAAAFAVLSINTAQFTFSDEEITGILPVGENEILVTSQQFGFNPDTLHLSMIDSTGAFLWTCDLCFDLLVLDVYPQGERILVLTSNNLSSEVSILEISRLSGELLEEHICDASLFHSPPNGTLLELEDESLLIISSNKIYSLDENWEISTVTTLPNIAGEPDLTQGAALMGDGVIEICTSLLGEQLMWYWMTPEGELVGFQDSGLMLVSEYNSLPSHLSTLITAPYPSSDSDIFHVSLRQVESYPGEVLCTVTSSVGWLPSCCASEEGNLILLEGSEEDYITLSKYYISGALQWQSEIAVPFPECVSANTTGLYRFGDGYALSGNLTTIPECSYGFIAFVDSTGTSGISNPPQNQIEVSVYPNPFSDTITVSANIPTTCLVSAEVFDLCGRSISNQSVVFSSSDNTLNIENLPRGVLLVRVTLEETNGSRDERNFRVTGI